MLPKLRTVPNSRKLLTRTCSEQKLALCRDNFPYNALMITRSVAWLYCSVRAGCASYSVHTCCEAIESSISRFLTASLANKTLHASCTIEIPCFILSFSHCTLDFRYPNQQCGFWDPTRTSDCLDWVTSLHKRENTTLRLNVQAKAQCSRFFHTYSDCYFVHRKYSYHIIALQDEGPDEEMRLKRRVKLCVCIGK